MSLLQTNAGYIWLNVPRPRYDATSNSLYFAWTDSSGNQNVGRYRYANQHWKVSKAQAGGGSADLHSCPDVLVLDAAGSLPGQFLCSMSVIGNTPTVRKSKSTGTSAWDFASTNVPNPQLGNGVYSVTCQTGDTARTSFMFFQTLNGANNSNYYCTSADGGVTWGAKVELVTSTGQRPSMIVYCPTSGNRIDINFSTGDAGDSVINRLYHGYLTISAGGTVSAFLSDGTPATLPFTPSNATLVYDGHPGGSANTSCWVGDIAVIGGTPTILFNRYGAGTTPVFTAHTIVMAQWNGSAWQTQDVIDGGSYSPNGVINDFYFAGRCLDPNDAKIVYVSRSYTGPGGAAHATDIRLEQYTYTGTFPSGSWAKTVDVSGNTSSANIWPEWSQGRSPTLITYLRGSYTDNSYTSWTSDLYAYPDLTIVGSYAGALKPTAPAWQATPAAVVAKGATDVWPMAASGSGGLLNYAPSGTNLTAVGSPTWGTGTYGPQASGFSGGANYFTANPASQNVAANFPRMQSYMFLNSSTSQSVLGSYGNSGNSNQYYGVGLNWGGSGIVAFIIRGDDGTDHTFTASGITCNDGNAHVASAVSYAINDHGLYFDGLEVARVNTTITAITADRFAIGNLFRNGSTSNGFTGSMIAAMRTQSGVPDPDNNSNNWLQGDFLEVTATGETGTGAGTLGAITGSGAGTAPDKGTGAGTLAAIAGSGTGTDSTPGSETGTGAGTLAAITGSGAGTDTGTKTGTGAGTLGAITGSGSGYHLVPGTGGHGWPWLTSVVLN